MADLTTEVAGETIHLLAERAIYWPRRKTLLVADLHLGKAATFRAAAIPLPGGTTSETLRRLSDAISRSGADRLIVLGDLFHARSGRSPRTLQTVEEWRQRYADLEILLVRGNHDLHAGDPPDEWRIHCEDGPLCEGPFVYRHEPIPAAEGYVLAGHLHPAALLNGRGRQSLTLPCFHFTPNIGTLPAFGDFTGCATIRPTRADQVFVIAADEVIDVRRGARTPP
jgi:uncharacterized protein